MVLTILKNISQWEGLSHILWNITHVWNHQPEIHVMGFEQTCYQLETWPMLVASVEPGIISWGLTMVFRFCLEVCCFQWIWGWKKRFYSLNLTLRFSTVLCRKSILTLRSPLAQVLMMSFNLAGGWIGKLPPKLTVVFPSPPLTSYCIVEYGSRETFFTSKKTRVHCHDRFR